MTNRKLRNKYQPAIGLEVHVQLSTASKIYAADSTAYGAMPNTNVSAITLAHPGALPVLNKAVVEHAIKMGLACGSDISREMIFDRKNYFYPDLPKGYQLTQDKTPICIGGSVTIFTEKGLEKSIALNRIHIEEDAGKSMHPEGETDTLVDLNRAGVPLIEMVTEPVITSAAEAAALIREVRRLVRYLEISDGNMEEGSLRCDVNVSVAPAGSEVLGKKVEVKNLNSMRGIQKAVEFEIDRQIGLLEENAEIRSETRDFDAETATTKALRTKEALNDYRYFPDPDLSPLYISDEWLASVAAAMPDLPKALFHRFVNDYGLPAYDAQVLTDNKEKARYFETLGKRSGNFKAASNWVMGPIKGYLNEAKITIAELPLPIERMAELIQLVDSKKVSFSMATQRLFPKVLESPEKEVLTLARELDLIQVSDTDTLSDLIDQVIATFPDKVKAYKKGKKGLTGFFMGEIMKRSKGNADPKLASELLIKRLV